MSRSRNPAQLNWCDLRTTRQRGRPTVGPGGKARYRQEWRAIPKQRAYVLEELEALLQVGFTFTVAARLETVGHFGAGLPVAADENFQQNLVPDRAKHGALDNRAPHEEEPSER